MVNPIAIRKLTRELQNLERDPVNGLKIKANIANILEWYFVFNGPIDSPYYQGVYFGKILFPDNYPFAPPDIIMITPNGRFQPNVKICTSATGFHPESWSPSWTLTSYLVGFISLMLDNNSRGIGTIVTDDETRQKLALNSVKYNQNIPEYLEYFGS